MVRLSASQRRGIKLLVVVIVLAVVLIVGVILVAGVGFMGYARVKEAAGRASCMNNMRSIGIAMQNYQSSMITFPQAADPKDNTTLFWRLRDQADLGVSNPNGPVTIYLCPSRRSPNSVAAGKAPADYGWAKDSILDSPEPLTMKSLTVPPGAVILLGHIGIRPQDYGGGDWDGPWKSNAKAYARTPAPLYPDDKVPNSTEYMGSPHRTAVPHLYADNSLKMIDYDTSVKQAELLKQLWQYNRKETVQDLGN